MVSVSSAQGDAPFSSSFPAEVRQARLRDLVAERGYMRVSELSGHFGVSTVTIRNDLDALEGRGELRRVHGGATLESVVRPEPTFEEAASDLPDEKRHIGRAAAALVSSGESVLIDVGTTTTAVARALVGRAELTDVTVFTNALNVAFELEPAIPRFTVVVTGGTLRPKQHSLVNPLGTAFLEQLNATTAFIGCNGVDLAGGVTNINLPEAEIKRAMMRAARRRVVVADGSKLGRIELTRVCPIDMVDILVTDVSADPGIVTELRSRGVNVIIAEGRQS